MKGTVYAIVNGERVALPSGGQLDLKPEGGGTYSVRQGNVHRRACVRKLPDAGYEIWIDRYRLVVKIQDEQQERLAAYIKSTGKLNTGSVVTAPMPGLVKEVSVARGDSVRKGQRLLILEAMKMENEITSPVEGTVTRCTLSPGTNVEKDQELLHITPANE